MRGQGLSSGFASCLPVMVPATDSFVWLYDWGDAIMALWHTFECFGEQTA